MANGVGRARRWLAPAGVVIAVAVLVPPVGTAATRYVFVQAIQFALLAVVVPALIVLGAPWRTVLRRRADAGGPDLADRWAAARSHRPGRGLTWAVLAGYLLIALGWRLPVAVNALVRHPALTLAEALTLIAAGCALWLELVESPPLLPRTTRPLRAAFAALPMWALWASAYIMGFSGSAWFSALRHDAAGGLSTVADQEIAAGLLWAIPALSFIPVVYVALLGWLRDSADPEEELRSAAGPWVRPPGTPDGERSALNPASQDGPLLRPPRGWRLPSS